MLELNEDSWPDSGDASDRKRRTGSELKLKKELYLASPSYKLSLFVLLCGANLARESRAIRKWREARAKTPSYFSWICAFARLSSTSLYTLIWCVYFMCFKGIRAWLQQGQLALSGPISTVPFHIAYAVAAAWQEHARRGTSVTSSKIQTSSYLIHWSPAGVPRLQECRTVKSQWCLSWLK